MPTRVRRTFLTATLAAISGASSAAEPPPPVDFERDVAPIFATACVGCHNASQPNGELNLSRREGALAGGESGTPAIVPGEVEESYLIERVALGEMPPKGKGRRLTSAEVRLIKRWVAAGALWPAERVLSQYERTTEFRAGRDWWSLVPVARPAVPTVADAPWIRTPIDAFVLQKLIAKGLAPSPDADRATFIRRAKFDLLGLPPTPEEIAEFVADDSPQAYERLIDRLLSSPHYGERWARHWLDVVRFGESNGYETNRPRQSAWPYRDYVVDAFNRDTPLPRFIVEQLAGDQVGVDVATGFLVGGAHDVVTSPDVELTLQQRQNDLSDMLSTTSAAFLGLSIGCAKCHDHKFDPITQRDYYAMQALFAGVQHGERQIAPRLAAEDAAKLPGQQARLAELTAAISDLAARHEPLARSGQSGQSSRRPVSTRGNIDRFSPVKARFVRFTALASSTAEPCIDELEIFTAEASPRNVALASAGGKATASGQYENGNSPIHKTVHVNDGLYGNSKSWISAEVGAGWVQIELPQSETIDRVAWARDRRGEFADRLATAYRIEVAESADAWTLVADGADRKPYVQTANPSELSADSLPPAAAEEFRRLSAEAQFVRAWLADRAPQPIYAGTFSAAGPTHLLNRGEPMQPREAVPPGFLEAVYRGPALAADMPEAERRLALARWLGSADNPLAARVMVNRIWHHHFGQGLVKTPGDFGFGGGRPSHPELLDWLCDEFMALDWQPKRLHRLIMLSSVYRQSSRHDERAAAVDAGGELLWRFNPRRLDAEPIRDAMLFVAGSLDTRMGGPGYDVFEPNENYVKNYVPKQSFGPAEWRRMVYQSKPRMQQDSTFGAFDCPDASQSVSRRNISTTALQALNLLNSPLAAQQAGLFAARVSREAGGDAAAQVRHAFWLALGRDAVDDEAAAARDLVNQHGLAALCRALLNSNEFVFLR